MIKTKTLVLISDSNDPGYRVFRDSSFKGENYENIVACYDLDEESLKSSGFRNLSAYNFPF